MIDNFHCVGFLLLISSIHLTKFKSVELKVHTATQFSSFLFLLLCEEADGSV